MIWNKNGNNRIEIVIMVKPVHNVKTWKSMVGELTAKGSSGCGVSVNRDCSTCEPGEHSAS